MLLYLTRHGKTDYNAKGLCQGQLNIPLNEEGRQAAFELGQLCSNLPLTKVYSSGLSRAYDTAEAIAVHHPGLSIELSPELKNQFWGPVQGHPNRGDPPDDQFETHEQLKTRLRAWLQGVIDIHVRGPIEHAVPPADPTNEDVVLAVSHEDCIVAIKDILLAPAAGDRPPTFITEIAPGVNITGRPVNTTLAQIRLSRARTPSDEGDSSSIIKARIEAWGSANQVAREQPAFDGLLDKWP